MSESKSAKIYRTPHWQTLEWAVRTLPRLFLEDLCYEIASVPPSVHGFEPNQISYAYSPNVTDNSLSVSNAKQGSEAEFTVYFERQYRLTEKGQAFWKYIEKLPVNAGNEHLDELGKIAKFAWHASPEVFDNHHKAFLVYYVITNETAN
jgi:hypothetical protein